MLVFASHPMVDGVAVGQSRLALRGSCMKTFQVRQSIHYDLLVAAGSEQEAILKSRVIPLTQWETENTEITAELVDETEEIDDY